MFAAEGLGRHVHVPHLPWWRTATSVALHPLHTCAIWQFLNNVRILLHVRRLSSLFTQQSPKETL